MINKNMKSENKSKSKFSTDLNNLNNNIESRICDPKSSFGLLHRIIDELNILYEQSIIGSIINGKEKEKENLLLKFDHNNIDRNNYNNFRRNNNAKNIYKNDEYDNKNNENNNRNNEIRDEENADIEMDIVLYGVISGIISGNLSH